MVPEWERRDDYRAFYDKIREWKDFELGLIDADNVKDECEAGNLPGEGKGKGKGQRVMGADGNMKDRVDKKDEKKDQWAEKGGDPWSSGASGSGSGGWTSAGGWKQQDWSQYGGGWGKSSWNESSSHKGPKEKSWQKKEQTTEVAAEKKPEDQKIRID